MMILRSAAADPELPPDSHPAPPRPPKPLSIWVAQGLFVVNALSLAWRTLPFIPHMPNAAARSFGVALAVFGLAALAQFRRAWVHWLFAAAVITFCARFLFRTTRELVDYLRAPNTPATEPGEHAGAVAGQIIVVIVITVFCTRVTLGEPARRYFRRGGA